MPNETTPGPRVAAEATRRDALRTAGGGVLALLAFLQVDSQVMAQPATPLAGSSLRGAYAVARVRKVKPDYAASEVSASVAAGFVPIVQEVPGFISYFVIADDAQGSWVSVGIFTDRAGAEESTRRAMAFGQQGTDEMVEGDPIIIEGTIEIAVP
jgi:quinol monooxygenase YgiN